MRKLGLDTAALLTTAFVAAAGASPAYAAANTAIILWNAANPGDAETATGTGSAFVSSSDLDGITITLSNVNRNPDGLTENNLNIDNTTTSVQTLDIIAGVNGLPGSFSQFDLSATILAALGGSDLSGSFFANNDNALNGTSMTVDGANIGSFNSGPLTGPFSFSFNGLGFDSVTGPFGAAETLSLVLQPGASVGVQSISLDAVVPEPRTWALMSLGFAFMAFLGLRKRKTARFAAI